MKKLMILLIGVLLTGAHNVSMAQDRAIPADQLPAKAQEFIKTHFPQTQISLAKIDKEMMKTSYEVVLADSTKIEFTKAGEWEDVDCKYSQVPSTIVPSQITNKVKELYPNNHIIEIERDSRDYEVKLNNRKKLKFDLKFNIINH